MLLLCLCLLSQIRFDETSSPPEAVRADPYAIWRLPDGSWRAPMPSGIPSGEWTAVPRYRWRATTGTVYEHPDRETLRGYVEAIDAARARRTAPARIEAPANYFVPIVPQARHAHAVSAPYFPGAETSVVRRGLLSAFGMSYGGGGAYCPPGGT